MELAVTIISVAVIILAITVLRLVTRIDAIEHRINEREV